MEVEARKRKEALLLRGLEELSRVLSSLEYKCLSFFTLDSASPMIPATLNATDNAK